MVPTAERSELSDRTRVGNSVLDKVFLALLCVGHNFLATWLCVDEVAGSEIGRSNIGNYAGGHADG